MKQVADWTNPALLESFKLARDGQTWNLTCACGWKETVGITVVLARLIDRAILHWTKAH